MRFKTYDKNQYFLKITSDLQYYNHYQGPHSWTCHEGRQPSSPSQKQGMQLKCAL